MASPEPEEAIVIRLTALVALVFALWPAAPAVAESPQLYWAQLGPDHGVIDVISVEKSNKILEKYGEVVSSDEVDGHLIADDEPLVPAIFAVGAKLTAVTTVGRVELEVVSRSIDSGAGEDHLYVRVKGTPKVAGPGLVVVGGKVGTGAKLRKVEAVAASKALSKAAQGKLVKELRAKTTEKRSKKAVAKARLIKHTTVVKGKLSGGVVGVAALTVPQGKAFDGYLSAFVLVGEDGRVVAVVKAPELGLERLQVEYLVDIDGDGIDEVVFDESYYEGSYLRVLFWDGKTVRTETLTGDGA